jgi:RNA polymerase sigma-70 factor (ECF subfamily)
VAANPTLVASRAPARQVESAADDAAVLYERYYDRVFGYCLYHLGSREEAEDVAQTTFMWAYRGLRRGVVPRAEASWLFTIAQNACRARHRTRGRRREREVLSDPVTLADMAPAPVADTDDLMGLEDALARMPELQRRAILLREWRGLSYKEIAAELELSNAAVETLIFRARRTLAELLGGRPAPKRAGRFAVDFGSMVAAAKAFLGMGTAAKVGAGLAAAVIATTVAGSVQQAPKQRPVSTTNVPVAIPHYVQRPDASVKTKAAPVKTAPVKAAQPKKAKPQMAAPSPVDPSRLERATDSLPRVPEATVAPVATVTKALDDTVAVVDEAVARLTPALP